jgi:mannosyltransferase
MSRRTTIWLLVLIIIIGISIRSFDLTARSLWFDEAFSWRLIQFSMSEMISRAIQDVHPPLYYIILKGWKIVFESSLLSIRSFSVTFAALSIAAGYLFTSYAFRSRFTGIIAAILLTLSGWQIQYAWEARMYTLGIALLLFSSWLLLKAVRFSKQKHASPTIAILLWISYAIVAAASIYTHYFIFLSLAAQALFVLFHIVRTTKGRLGEMVQLRTTWYAVMTAVIIVLLYSPWIPIFIQQNSQVQEAYWIPDIGGWSIPDTFYRMFVPTSHIPAHTGIGNIALAMLPIIATIGGIILLIIGRGKSSIKNQIQNTSSNTNDANWFVAILSAVPFILAISLSFVGASLYQDRFFIFAHTFIIIALATLLSRIKFKSLRIIAILLVVIGFIATYTSYWRELNLNQKGGSHAATRAVYQQRQPDEPVIATSPFIFFSVLHYAKEEFNSNNPHIYSETGELAHFAGGPILKQEDIVGPEVFNTEKNTIWIVDTTGFGSTALELPPEWQSQYHESFPEVFPYQGDVMVTKYIR